MRLLRRGSALCLPNIQRIWLAAGLAILLLTGLALTWRLRSPVTLSTPSTPSTITPSTPSPSLVVAPPAVEIATPSPTPTRLGGGGLVAYSFNGDLMVADLVAGTPTRLTFNAGQVRDPTFSADGRSLVFTARRDANWDLFRLQLADGSTARLTTQPGYDGHPAWSPDGRWIAFETILDGDLDIAVVPANGGEVTTLVSSPAAETAPSWSPDGRWLVYGSYSDGQRDLYRIAVEGGTPINLTQSANQDEDEPALSPDGRQLAYSVGLGGERALFVAPVDINAGRLMTETARLVGQGAAPAWSPDGANLAYQVPSLHWPRMQVSEAISAGTTLLTWPADLFAGRPAWTAAQLPEPPAGEPHAEGTADSAWTQATAPIAEPTPLYVERLTPMPVTQPYYNFVSVPVQTGGPYLSDRVDDSFRALRQRVVDEAGFDYLNIFGDMWRPTVAESRTGQSERSWHKAGRAFDINQGPYGPGQDVAIVQETFGGTVYWRVYFRTARQDGAQGEPLRVPPWDFTAQPASGDDPPTGGAPRPVIPSGYWLDFTSLAAEYGWYSLQALENWRTYYPDTEWWHFQKTDGLSWIQAMREVYSQEEIDAAFGAELPRLILLENIFPENPFPE